ncbi:formylglycine-generating enzyme family protein [Nannocystaceae bacterium ST9]
MTTVDGDGDTMSDSSSDATADDTTAGDTTASDTTASDTTDTSPDTSTDTSTESSTESTTESSTDTGTTTSTSTDTDGGDCAGVCGTMGCGDCPDNGSVNIPGNFSISSTEVRNAHYAAFLEIGFTQDFLAGWLPAECAWKNDFTPDDWPNNPEPNKPVTDVDWCDAWAYCEWSGQHLCGKIGGGPAPLGDLQNPATNQWYKACTGGGVKNYPYGLNYMAAACNGMDAGLGMLTDVGSLMTCVGGYAGIFDMSGNVWEWENSCDADPMVAVEDQECRQRGGSFYSNGPTLRCGIDSVRARNFRNNNLGIRCCDMP